MSKEIIPKKLRKKILERDNHTSQMRHYDEEKGWHTGGYCDDGGEGCENLHVHHITPQRMGGKDEPDNLITVFSCEHNGVCPDEKIKDGYYRE